MKNFWLCNILGGKQDVLIYERCANGELPKVTTAQQESLSWFPQLIVVLWLLVQIIQIFLTGPDCGYLVCLRPFPDAGHITTAFSKFTE